MLFFVQRFITKTRLVQEFAFNQICPTNEQHCTFSIKNVPQIKNLRIDEIDSVLVHEWMPRFFTISVFTAFSEMPRNAIYGDRLCLEALLP